MASAEDGYYIVCEDRKIAELEGVALRGLDLRVRTGELVASVGASGSGKTTLLNLLAGLDRASSGAVYFQGRELTRLRCSHTGFVFQSFGLLPLLSACGECGVASADCSVGPGGAPPQEGCLSVVGMAGRAHHRPAQGDRRKGERGYRGGNS